MTKDRRPVIKWPPGILADARAAAGPRGLSAFTVGCALGVMTEAEGAAVRAMADALHDLAVQQIALANRLAKNIDLDEAEQARRDLVAFKPASILVSPGDLEAVSVSAAAAGFLRHDQPQPLGNPNLRNRDTMARSFSAFLRAAVAAELDPRKPEVAGLRAAEKVLAAALEAADHEIA